MKKGFAYIFLLMLCISILGGCGKQAQPFGRAVTKVEVVCRRPGQTVTRTYTQEHKMRAVLTYLRLLEPTGYASLDPETTRTQSSVITVSLSDGSVRHYEQAGSEFLRKDQRHWQRISGIGAQRLYMLIHAIETDES